MPTPRAKRDDAKKAAEAAKVELIEEVDEEDDAVDQVDETLPPLEEYPAAMDAKTAASHDEPSMATFEEQMEAARKAVAVFDDERELKQTLYTKKVDEIAARFTKARGVRRVFEACVRCLYAALVREDPGFDSTLADTFVCAKNTLREMMNAEHQMHIEAQYYTALAAIDEECRFETFPGAAIAAVRATGPKAFAEDVEKVWAAGSKHMEDIVSEYCGEGDALNLGYSKSQLLEQLRKFHTRAFLDYEASFEQAFGACSLTGEACHKLPAKKK